TALRRWRNLREFNRRCLVSLLGMTTQERAEQDQRNTASGCERGCLPADQPKPSSLAAGAKYARAIVGREAASIDRIRMGPDSALMNLLLSLSQTTSQPSTSCHRARCLLRSRAGFRSSISARTYFGGG